MEKEAGDVGEQGAVALSDAFLRDEREELGHDAAEFFAGAEFWAAGEELIGDGLDLGVSVLFVETFMDDAESGGSTAERIEAASAMSGSEAAAIFQRDLSSRTGGICNFW